MKYYYLKGIEKIGPLTLDELKEVSLTDETLIWFESLKEWTKFSDLLELKKEILGIDEELPPAIPEEIINKETEELKIQETEIKKNNNLKTILVIISFIIIGLALFIAYSTAKKQVDNDKEQLINKIDYIFQSKTTVCDGVNYEIFGNRRAIKPNKSGYLDSYLLKYSSEPINKIVEEFTLTKGGFIVYRITKEDNGFVVKKSVASNMIYKVGEYEYSYGYNMPSYRPTISSCYSKVFNFLTSGQKDGSYIPNIYDQIQGFDKLQSVFFKISNETNHRTNGSHWWQENDGLIYEQFSVYFRSDYWYYEIKSNDTEISKKYTTIIFLGFIIGIAIVGILNVIIYIVRKSS